MMGARNKAEAVRTIVAVVQLLVATTTLIVVVMTR